MTVSTTIIKNSHSGNGTAHQFAYGFKIFADADLDVIIRSAAGVETVKTLNTDYIVTNAGNDSGGNVLFKFNTGNTGDAHYSASDKRPQNGETVILRRGLDITQSTDYVANDPFPAESHEDALDRLTFISQEIQEATDRSIKLSRTNTMTSTEFTTSASDRANKVLSFDGSGELAVTQELGTFKGDWAASTAYLVRDIVKDTSTNNIFIVTTAHTSSGSEPLTTNANSAKYSLIVDAASSTTAQNNAAASATASANSATASANSATSSSNSASTSTTKASEASTSASNAASSATAASNAQAAAEAALDTFDDRFLGAKSSNPSVDNDGNALLDGALYFDTTNDIMKVYDLTNTQWRQLTLTSTNQNNVNTVAGAISNVNTVAGSISNINTANSNITNIDTVAGISSNVTTVAGISSNVTTVAGISSNVTSVAGNSSNINSAVSNATNINTVAAALTNINTVASNLSGVNSFAARYRVESSDPSSNNDEGDLVYNTTDNNLKFFNGSNFVSVGGAISNIVEDTTPQLGGNLDINGNSIVSTSDGNINITPNGTGKVVLDGLSYPTSDGTNGQVITTNGSGVLSFGTVDLSVKANIASPTFTGTPAAPTASAGTNTTQLATTAFVTTAVANAEPFPSGTSMLFQQTNAPTGWTKQTTHNDKALRIVTGTVGTGGSTAFSTALGTPSVAGGSVSGSPGSNLSVNVSGNISNHTLSINQIPSHSHQTKRAETGGNLLYYGNSVGFGGNIVNNNNVVPTANAGGGGSHNHGHNLSGSISGNITAGNLSVGSSTASINVNYVDFIIANKD